MSHESTPVPKSCCLNIHAIQSKSYGCLSPLVSVVIPIYMVEKYIVECVESVLQQTLRDIEVILVDDGSTDECPYICDEYVRRDNRVRVIHKDNGGQSSARNVGIDAAIGTWIYFLDGDDYLECDALEKCVQKGEQENVDFLFFDTKVVSELDDFSTTLNQYGRSHTYSVQDGWTMCKQLLDCNEFFVGVPFLFIRRSHLVNLGLRFYEGIVHEDDLFTPLLFLQSRRVTYLPEKLYIRRYRNNSTMTTRRTGSNFYGKYVAQTELMRFLSTLEMDHSQLQVARRLLLAGYIALKNIYRSLSISEKKVCRPLLKHTFSDMADLPKVWVPFCGKTNLLCYGTFIFDLQWFKARRKLARKFVKAIKR